MGNIFGNVKFGDKFKFCQDAGYKSIEAKYTEASTTIDTEEISEAMIKISEMNKLIMKEPKTIYQIRYSKGSYDSFTTWCSDELYETRELAERAMNEFKEENSLDNLWKKMKLSTKEDWGEDYELPSIYVVDYETVPKHLDMSMDEFNEARGSDVLFFYEYLSPGEGYHYDAFDIVERKLIMSDL